MSTEYTQRVTIAAPELLTSLANELALCLGESRADDQTFIGANYQDVDGNLYSIASTVAKSVFAEMAGLPLQAPAHAPNVDLKAASKAQSILKINDGIAGPDVIAVILGSNADSAQDHIAALGLKRVLEPEMGT
jgi:hypothetical protein